jgi:hypothetical protein
MKMKWLLAVLTTLISFVTAHECDGQLLVSRSFDLIYQGDDPSERYDFLLPYDPAVPVIVRFNGFLENLAPEETGVRYGIAGLRPDRTGEGRQFTDEMGVRLPPADPVLGTTHVPIVFEQPITFTPAETYFWVEGLGGSDYFRFAGDFSIQAVPEPTASALLGCAAMLALLSRLCKKRSRGA